MRDRVDAEIYVNEINEEGKVDVRIASVELDSNKVYVVVTEEYYGENRSDFQAAGDNHNDQIMAYSDSQLAANRKTEIMNEGNLETLVLEIPVY